MEELLKVTCEVNYGMKVTEGKYQGMQLFIEEDEIDNEWYEVLVNECGETQFIVIEKEVLELDEYDIIKSGIIKVKGI